MTKFFGNRNDEVGEKCERIDEKHNEAASHPLNNTICQVSVMITIKNLKTCNGQHSRQKFRSSLHAK